MKLCLAFLMGIICLVVLWIFRFGEAAPLRRIVPLTESSINVISDVSPLEASVVEILDYEEDSEEEDDEHFKKLQSNLWAAKLTEFSTTKTTTTDMTADFEMISNLFNESQAIKRAEKLLDYRTLMPELTIPVTQVKTDAVGNQVINPWDFTFADVFRDTRFNIGGPITIQRIVVDSILITRYYSRKTSLASVCDGRSTVYNKPAIMDWLPIYMYSKPRNITYKLRIRLELYKRGRGDECHTRKYDHFYKYINCALLRNQRMDYLVPQYPLHLPVPKGFQ